MEFVYIFFFFFFFNDTATTEIYTLSLHDALPISPAKASSRSSWYEGRASLRCSNCPDIAIRRSPADDTSSRATPLPQAYARVRPSAKTRRASTSPSSSSGRSSEERRVGKECRSRWSPYH